MKISGSVTLITGASSGIGAALAAELRRRGARLVLTGRSTERLARIAQPEDLVLPGDLCDSAFRDTLIQRSLDRFGHIDILVNNAGYGMYAPPTRSPLDDVRDMFELNLFAPLHLIQLAAPLMKERGSGIIVNISSVAGRLTLPWLSIYSASKFALCALSEGLRSELSGAGIQVMTVCPGYVKTAFPENVRGAAMPPSLRNPSHFAITAAECANAIVRGIEKGAATVVTPGSARLLLLAARLFPWQTERFLARFHRQLEQQA
ncbi:SDR family NAD(P)-dependent oxidoreductase [Paludibaculum fermentans]|uniref:SDR family NAD(P)-dependent oxidoreductase n=1 Tax=Paludibaculum fermentans TaxID=1473598 RepID=A0A7S7NKD4_PALFE|nr:SDR family NAD(P)-dependent oxidoreductase [Paludibaculum fermentans]QOY85246.1 SDR family NAD(P)-dependent oxidoreductase [Paludibaculum fermentans]